MQEEFAATEKAGFPGAQLFSTGITASAAHLCQKLTLSTASIFHMQGVNMNVVIMSRTAYLGIQSCISP